MKCLHFLLAVLASSNMFSQYYFQWANTSEGIGLPFVTESYSIKHDMSGNAYVVGRFTNTVDFAPGPSSYTLFSNGGSDAFITKFDPIGNFVWAKSIGGVSSDFAVDVETDSGGNVFITGYVNGVIDFDPGPGIYTLTTQADDAFVWKLNSSGNLIWAKVFGSSSIDHGTSIKVDGTGNVYVTGSYTNTIDLDPGPGTYTVSGGSIFALKLDPAGNFLWGKSLNNGSIWSESATITVDTQNNIYIKGLFRGTADLDPGVGVYTLSTVTNNMFVTKLDIGGNFVWSVKTGGTVSWLNFGGESLQVDASGNVFAVCSFSGTEDFDPGPGTMTLTSTGPINPALVKFDSNGNLVWVNQITPSGPAQTDGNALALDGLGGVFITGSFSGVTDFDPSPNTFTLSSLGLADVFIAKYSTTGSFLWAGSIRGDGNKRGFGISADQFGNIYATGTYPGNADFDPGPSTYTLFASSNNNYYALKLNNVPNGINEVKLDQKGYVYPNPTTGVFHISDAENLKATHVIVQDYLGRKIYFTDVQDLDLSRMPAGIYFYFLFSEGRHITSGKIIKE